MASSTTPTILLVEDDLNVAFVTSAALRLQGMNVIEAVTARQGLQIVTEAALGVDLALLDVMLPDIDGFELCRRLRSSGYDMPIIFLTARDATRDRIKGLTIGGDDYLTKPFSVEELIARTRAVLRRIGKSFGELYQCGDLTLDDAAYKVTKGGQAVELSPTEYKLLRFFLRNAGKVVTKDQILDHVWDYDFPGESTVVETYISTLRKKVDRGDTRLIHTLRGVGYRMGPA
jgi:two-component system OmpR family response regulator